MWKALYVPFAQKECFLLIDEHFLLIHSKWNLRWNWKTLLPWPIRSRIRISSFPHPKEFSPSRTQRIFHCLQFLFLRLYRCRHCSLPSVYFIKDIKVQIIQFWMVVLTTWMISLFCAFLLCFQICVAILMHPGHQWKLIFSCFGAYLG